VLAGELTDDELLRRAGALAERLLREEDA
jgi:hypothetical protein